MSKFQTELRPGDHVYRDLHLYVKDANGKTLGEIDVKSGTTVPPSTIKGATHYSTEN